MTSDQLRKIPGVDTLLNHPKLNDIKSENGIELLTYSVRQVLSQIRDSVRKGGDTPDENKIISQIKLLAGLISNASLKKVINATGVILHTNLGRAPLGKKIIREIELILSGYSNLEFNLSSAKRGKRTDHIRELMKYITGAEDAVVVNNNAAGVSLTLRTLAEGKEVIISRGELIEIGGSFRLPEIMSASGSIMVEVGTTNRTRIVDYERAITENTRIILKAHKSNYFIDGFVEEVELNDLSELARKHKLIFVYDIGSGLLKKMNDSILSDEPDVQSSLKKGVDIITFSGDKLLGGPQAGIIAGKKKFISKIAKAPLMRTYRVDKMTIGILSSVLRSYIKGESLADNLPVFAMLRRTSDDLKNLADMLQKELKKYNIDSVLEKSTAQIGGGTVPHLKIDSFSVKLVLPGNDKKAAEKIFYGLLRRDIPLLGILRKGEIHFDVFTIFEEEIALISKIISEVA